MGLYMRILLVEDERDVATVLAKGLRARSYAVDLAHDGHTAIEKAEFNPYDLILLDVLLPGKSGVEVCKELRNSGSTTPILLLTARVEVSDRILGLDSGADDYLTKPFDFEELLARIRALLRRGPALKKAVLRLANLELDTRAHSVRCGDLPVELTSKEYALLEYLVHHQDEVVSREDISEHVWEESYNPFSNLIEVYVQRLRRKLEPPGAPRLLHTRRGEGYVLSAGEQSPCIDPYDSASLAGT
jgi:DNA-binding response OmpR family regulator